MPQPIQVERQCVGRDADRVSDIARGHTVRPGLNEDAVDCEPVLLREGCKGGHGIGVFHISTIIELMYGLSRET